MQLTHSFRIPVPVEEAWTVLRDIERVAPCMPGATIDSVDGDDFTGGVKVKVGPISMTYKGEASFVDVDDANHRASIEARGRDVRGSGTARATVKAELRDLGDETEVTLVTDLAVTGKPAQFGRGVMADVGGKLVDQFAQCLSTKLGAGETEQPMAATTTNGSGPATADAAGSSPPPAAPPGAAEGSAAPLATPKLGAAGTADAGAAQRTGPAEPAGSTPSPAAAPRADSAPRPPASEPEAIDLFELAGGSLARRLGPAVGALAALLALWALVRGRRGGESSRRARRAVQRGAKAARVLAKEERRTAKAERKTGKAVRKALRSERRTAKEGRRTTAELRGAGRSRRAHLVEPEQRLVETLEEGPLAVEPTPAGDA